MLVIPNYIRAAAHIEDRKPHFGSVPADSEEFRLLLHLHANSAWKSLRFANIELLLTRSCLGDDGELGWRPAPSSGSRVAPCRATASGCSPAAARLALAWWSLAGRKHTWDPITLSLRGSIRSWSKILSCSFVFNLLVQHRACWCILFMFSSVLGFQHNSRTL